MVRRLLIAMMVGVATSVLACFPERSARFAPGGLSLEVTRPCPPPGRASRLASSAISLSANRPSRALVACAPPRLAEVCARACIELKSLLAVHCRPCPDSRYRRNSCRQSAPLPCRGEDGSSTGGTVRDSDCPMLRGRACSRGRSRSTCQMPAARKGGSGSRRARRRCSGSLWRGRGPVLEPLGNLRFRSISDWRAERPSIWIADLAANGAQLPWPNMGR